MTDRISKTASDNNPDVKKREASDSSLVSLDDLKQVSAERQAEERKMAANEFSADIDEGKKLSPGAKYLDESRELGALFLKSDLAGVSDFVKKHAGDPRMPVIVNELDSHCREYNIATKWIAESRMLAFYESGLATTKKPGQEALIFAADGSVSARQRDGEKAVPNGKDAFETLSGLSRQVVDGIIHRKQLANSLVQTINLNADLLPTKNDGEKQELAIARQLAESLVRGRLADVVPVFQRQVNDAQLPGIAEKLEALTKDMGLVTEIEDKRDYFLVGVRRGINDGYLCALPLRTARSPLAERLNAGKGSAEEIRSLLYRPAEILQEATTPVMFRDAAKAISARMTNHYYSQFY